MIGTFARLLKAHASTTRELSSQLQAEHGLTLNDYECLLLLSHSEGDAMRRIDLAEQLILTPSGVTRLLDGLQEAGFIANRACESDARVKYAALTQEGRRKLEEASQSHLASVADLFGERYSDEELSTLAELLGRLPGAGGDGSGCSPGHA
ncbi:MAG TPA: MarR family transcriptional regulator [Gaiellaceae bacterium]|nr:MarR family transcriptional regulator [Gaiellaceae bacterium]